MIYQLSQVSNRDTQVLYFYRILRQASAQGCELFRYDSPDVFFFGTPRQVTLDDSEMYEYSFSSTSKPGRVPYLEFQSDSESELKYIEQLTELEITKSGLILRGNTDKLTDKTLVYVYWVPSLDYINQIQAKIADLIDKLSKRKTDDASAINRLNLSSDFLIGMQSRVPDLVAIGTDGDGLIYDDSNYRLSGSVDEQLILNPTQDTISSILKSHTGTLIIKDNTNDSKVFQGFYGGCIKLSGKFKTLVLQSITSIILLTGITAEHLIIDNCPAVMLRESLEAEGESHEIHTMDVRNSYLTINQPVLIDLVGCYRNSTIVQKKGNVARLGFLEAGSVYVLDHPSDDNEIDILRTSAMQGLFYTTQAPVDKPYLDEIFLSQKSISFQRGQVEDPVPISKADVSIYLKRSAVSAPSSPEDSYLIYTPYTDWYWSGDDRVVGLIQATEVDGIGHTHGVYADAALDVIDIRDSLTENIAVWWGMNDLDKAADYAALYTNLANNSANIVFVCTLGYCPDSTGSGRVDGDQGQDLETFNQSIAAFNSVLSNELVDVQNIYVLDVDSYVHELVSVHGASWVTEDNYHYTADAYQAIEEWVVSQITNINPNVYPVLPGTTNAEKIWNWFGNSGISVTPELVAGVIGNFQQESYEAIDVLGTNNGFYGPWCESNIGFYNYLINRGYSFHPYTPNCSVADDGAIDAALVWLTEQSDSWVNWFMRVVNDVQDKEGEAGARAYAELFCVCIERCVGGADSIDDPGVYQIMKDYYGGTVYTYQELGSRRSNAASIYRQFMTT